MTQEEIVAANDAKLAEADKQRLVEEAEAKTAEEAAKKQEEASVYKKENDRLEKENAEKAGALKEEREKRKVAEAAAEAIAKANGEAKGLTREEAEKLWDEKNSKRDFEQFLGTVSADPEEQKLVRHHYEHSILKTGNVVDDLKKAVAIANQHLIEKTKEEEVARQRTEGMGTRFTAGNYTGAQGKPAYQTDPTLKATAAFLERIGRTDAVKHLGK